MSMPLAFMNLMNEKHVNLSLETAFVFDPKDSNNDLALIKTVRSFLDSLQHAVSRKAKLRTDEISQQYYKLSDYVYDLGKHILGYSDENIQRFAVALQTVVEDYFPSGTVFHKIIYDPRLKAFIKNSLKEWAESDAKVLRKGLQAMYKGPNYGNTFVDLVKTLNVVFDKDDSDELKKYVKEFEAFPRSQKKLEAKIDKNINSLVFERYKMLNFTMKSVVLDAISKVAEYVNEAFRNRSVDPEFLMKRSSGNVSVIEPSAEIGRPHQNASEFSGSERDYPLNPNDSLERIIKSSVEDRVDDLNEIEKKIVLNKVLEIDVNNAGHVGNETKAKNKKIIRRF